MEAVEIGQVTDAKIDWNLDALHKAFPAVEQMRQSFEVFAGTMQLTAEGMEMLSKQLQPFAAILLRGPKSPARYARRHQEKTGWRKRRRERRARRRALARYEREARRPHYGPSPVEQALPVLHATLELSQPTRRLSFGPGVLRLFPIQEATP